MKTHTVRKTLALALAAALCIGATTGAALAGDTAVGGGDTGSFKTPPPVEQPEPLPPNCEVVHHQPEGSDFGVAWVECHLPPECEMVNEYNPDTGIGVSYIECDLESGCTLQSGEWNGQTYWFIHCDESECIGGCDPSQPIDPVLAPGPKPLPDPGFVPVSRLASTSLATR